MAEFLIALGCFLAAHLVPAAPLLRTWLIRRLGRPLYLGAYSLLSLVLLGWVIFAARRAETILLWEPASWQWLVPFIVMPFAAMLLAGGLLEPNPLSISLRAGAEPGPITTVTRHPVLWAFLIWALAHIPPNGRLVAVILFGAMALFSIAGLLLVDLRTRRQLGDDRWRQLSAGTSVLPFAALISGRARPVPWKRLALPGAVGLVAYVWFLLQGHALLIGPDPVAGLAVLLGLD